MPVGKFRLQILFSLKINELMKYFRIFTMTIFFVAVFSAIVNKLRAQSTYEIGNVNYRFEGAKLLISYDILKSKSGETYYIWLEVITSSGEKITPVSVYGDVKRGIVPGKKRTIIWDTHADDIFLDEGFQLKVLGTPEGRKESVPDSIVQKYDFPHYTDIGLGFGMDYGGIFGAKFTFTPIKYFGAFIAGGLQFGGFAWQVGVKGYAIPKTSKKGFRPNMKAMYGVNAVIYVSNADEYNALYTGPSLGPGMEFRFGRLKKHGMDVDLNFPIRSQTYKNDWEKLKNDPNIEVLSEPLPFSISFGYHVEF
jgi:hypothetical protein